MRMLKIASRSSELAMAQTRYVIAQLQCKYPGLPVEIVNVSTQGDQDTATALWKLEGTGFFTTQIEKTLLQSDADLAVHSFKDLPTCPTDGLTVAAVCNRSYVEDVLVARPGIHSFNELPHGSKVGTSSLRRRAQLKRLRPDIETLTIRGKIQTRIEKVEQGDFDAIVIARAGLERLGMADKITEIFDPLHFFPAPAQGALAVQCRSHDDYMLEILHDIDDQPSRITSLAERKVLDILEGGCHAPVGAYARITAGQLTISAFVSDLDGERFLTSDASGEMSHWSELAHAAAQKLLDDGAIEILEELKP